MTGRLTQSPMHGTDTQYALGQHQDWEVSAHEAENEFFKKHGHGWSYSQRKTWLERYFTITPWHQVHLVRDCSVCVIEKEMMLLDPNSVQKNIDKIWEETKRLTRSLAVQKPKGKRHIDLV